MQTLAVYMDNELSAAIFFLSRVEGKELDFVLNRQLSEASTIHSFTGSLQTWGVKVRYISNFFSSFGQVA